MIETFEVLLVIVLLVALILLARHRRRLLGRYNVYEPLPEHYNCRCISDPQTQVLAEDFGQVKTITEISVNGTPVWPFLPPPASRIVHCDLPDRPPNASGSASEEHRGPIPAVSERVSDVTRALGLGRAPHSPLTPHSRPDAEGATGGDPAAEK